MVQIKEVRKGKKKYYYLVHSYREEGVVKRKQLYLKENTPEYIKEKKKEFIQDFYTEKFFNDIDKIKKNFDVIIPVYHKHHPLAYALIGDIADKVGVGVGIKHLNFIQTLTSIIVVAIENKKLAKENIRQAAIKKELELASEMQSMLFPSKRRCTEP